MKRTELTLGELTVANATVRRSQVRWLASDGHRCAAGEPIAYCSIGLQARTRVSRDRPFADEELDLQVALAAPRAGTVRHASQEAFTGARDRFQLSDDWAPDFVAGYLECDSDAPQSEPAMLRFFAGRRFSEIADTRMGLLTGWYDRSRAWPGEREAVGTLACLGSCEQESVVLGEHLPFSELLDAADGRAHVVYVPDDALVPAARITAEQLARTPEGARDIAADFARTFGTGNVVPSPREWIFMNAMIASLLRSPLSEPLDLLSRGGVRRITAPDAVLCSLNAEPVSLLRHRTLGYSLHQYGYRIAMAGPAVLDWLRKNFEQVKRTPDDIKGDYEALIDAARARGDMQFLVINVVSTFGTEQVQRYNQFERPLGNVLGSVRARELNVMLHDLARARNVAIVDCDAMAADFGGRLHVPDRMHGSPTLQREVRNEIVRLLRDRRVGGFM